MSQDYPYKPQKIDTTIALGEGTSGVIDLAGYTLAAIMTPTALTGGTITYLCGTAAHGTTPVGQYSPVFNPAGVQLATIAGTNQVLTDLIELSPLRYIQLVMGTQSAARNFTILLK
jgi:hypothetical protein